jgi:succinate dehydrogenase / fumarate reductase membrane anchor subunit
MAADPASIRTAARRVRYLGSARSGTRESWAMRVSSVALVPLAIAFVWLLLSLLHKDYAAARAEIGEPLPAILLTLFILTGVYHMKLGMQSIIDDYVHGAHMKDWLLMANLFFAVCVGLACIYAVLKISFA